MNSGPVDDELNSESSSEGEDVILGRKEAGKEKAKVVNGTDASGEEEGEEEEEEEEYVVEEVMSHYFDERDVRRHYLVYPYCKGGFGLLKSQKPPEARYEIKWQGYTSDQNTYEKESDLEFVSQYGFQDHPCLNTNVPTQGR